MVLWPFIPFVIYLVASSLLYIHCVNIKLQRIAKLKQLTISIIAGTVPTIQTRLQTEDNPAPLGSSITTVDSTTGQQRVVSCDDLVLYCNPVLGLPAVANQCPVTCLRCSRATLPPFEAPTTAPSIVSAKCDM